MACGKLGYFVGFFIILPQKLSTLIYDWEEVVINLCHVQLVSQSGYRTASEQCPIKHLLIILEPVPRPFDAMH